MVLRVLFAPVVLALVLAPCVTAYADDDAQTLIIKGSREKSSELFLEREADPVEPDIAQSLNKLPGANFNQNGQISVLPQYRGHIGSRTSVSINGFAVVPVGPNLMDAPLSYAVSNWVDQVTLYRGIAPVSTDIDSLGSHIAVHFNQPDFNLEAEGIFQGGIKLGLSSAGNASDKSLDAGWANDSQRVQLLASDQEGDEFETPRGQLNNTQFDKQAQQINYGFKVGEHQFDAFWAKQNVGLSGTPALPMDIVFVDGERVTADYQWNGDDIIVKAGMFSMDAEHAMNNFTLRPLMMTPMARYVYAESTGEGFSAAVDWQHDNLSLSFGIEQRESEHSMLITNPNNPMFRVENFNQVENETLSAYVESNWSFSNKRRLMAGLRTKTTDIDTGEVSHFMAGMNPVVAALQNRFNTADRERSMSDVDWMAAYFLPVTAHFEWYFGVGQKSRAPNYQELYLWLPLEATGGLADGNVYVGDVHLNSEQASQFEVGFTLQTDVIRFTPQFYYHDLNDYIQGVVETNPQVLMFANAMGVTGNVLRFTNVEGSISGFDAALTWQLSENWLFDSVISLIRGERDDVSEPLYRIMPDNIRWSIQYRGEAWTSGVDMHAVKSQDRVSGQLNEQSTPGYGLINLFADWQVNQSLRLAAGINNLLDTRYATHLAGRNRVVNNIIPVGEQLPGVERYFYASINWTF